MALEFHDSECLIKNQHKTVVARVVRESPNGLYRQVGQTIQNCSEVLACHMSSHNSNAMIWHKRLGHFHHQGMRRLIHTGAVRGLPNVRVGNFTCTSCIQGKQSRAKVPEIHTTKTSCILELVHTDVCGPLRVKSIGKAVYFLTLTDDYSKKTWIYFLNHKSQCLEKFKQFHKEVENSGNTRIVTFRSEGDGPIRVSQPRINGLPEWMEKDCNYCVLHCPFLRVLEYTSFVLALAPNLNPTILHPCWIIACPTNCKSFL
jgi:hypothetical protein